MPFTAVCAGTTSTLALVEADGTVYLLSPAAHGASILFSTRQPRVAVFPGGFVLVNCPSKSLWIDLARALVIPTSIPPPTNPPVVTDGADGGLFAGGDTGVRISHVVKDYEGQIISESALGPEGRGNLTVGKMAHVAFEVSDEAWVTGRRLYRADGGSDDYFHWLDVDDNVTVAIEDGASLESISTVAAPTYVQGPVQLRLVVEHKGRLFGVSPAEPDTLFGTDAGLFYSWPLEFPIQPVGGDPFGVAGLLARRDELAVLRHEFGWRLIGDQTTNFKLIRAFEGKGCVSADTCKVIRDVGYWLSPDQGVYTWSSEGVISISDARTRGWFTTSDYFNKAQFGQALAAYDPINHAYVLLLCSAGSSVIDRWVAYDIDDQRWTGPHKTGLTTLRGAAAAWATDGTGILQMGGGDGSLYALTPLAVNDGPSTAIDFDVTPRAHTEDPDKENYFGELTTFVKSGSGILTITPSVGTLEAGESDFISHNTTLERKRSRRLGQGNYAKLRFRMNTAGKIVQLRGYEIANTYVVGKR